MEILERRAAEHVADKMLFVSLGLILMGARGR